MAVDPQHSGPIGTTLESVAAAERYHAWLAQALADHLVGPVLEIGAGIGTLSLAVAKLGIPVFASEPDPTLAGALRERTVPIALVSPVEALMLPLGDGDPIPEGISTVLMSNVLEHIEHDVEALVSIRTATAAGTRLALVVPAHQWSYTGLDGAIGHYRRYTRKGLIDVCERADWHVLHTRYFNPIGVFTWWLSGRVFRRTEIARWQTRIVEAVVPVLMFVDRLFGGRWVGQSVIAIAESPGPGSSA
jgi:SAM-dependent methyltransferase